MTDNLFLRNQRPMISLKLLMITLLLYFLCFSGFAQKAQSSTLFKIDSSRIKVYGLRIQGDKITYRLSLSKKAKTYIISQSQCIKVRYANGKETIFKKPDVVPQQVVAIEKDTLKTIVITQKPTPKPQRPDRIYIKKSGIIDCKIIDINDREIRYIVVSDDSQRIRSISKRKVEKVERNLIIEEKANIGNKEIKLNKAENKTDDIKKVITNNANSYLDITLFANGNYMFGSSQWQNPSVGYGHLGGWGSGILGEYQIKQKVSIGLKLSYNAWKTTLKFKESSEGVVYKQHTNEINQIPIEFTFRYTFGKHIYIMPEGGISFITVKTDELDILDSFSKVQTTYGLNVGYMASVNKWLSYDVSSFYYNFSAKDLEPMRYAGVRVGLKVSIK